MLVTTKKMLIEAKQKGYAIPAPDFWDSNSCKSFLEVAEKLKKPIILSYAPVHKEMLSLEEAFNIAKYYALKVNTDVAIHLDHGSDVQICKKAIDLGFTSVMIDASKESYEENVKRSKEVVDYAHSKGVSVEAEIGHVGQGNTYNTSNNDSIYTQVDKAVSFVLETGVDSLAVSIGTAHGLYKGVPSLSFERLQELNQAISIPLVLHGGSGTGEENLSKAAKMGISKINVFTDFVVAALQATKEKNYDDWFTLIKEANNSIKEKLEYYYGIFGA